MYCPACGTQNPDANVMCDHCKQPLHPAPMLQMSQPPTNNTFGGLIPANNPNALMSYYLGIFSLFPLLGFFLGVAAMYLGVKGLKAFKADPAVRGRTHAWVGLICGTLFGLLMNGFFLLMILLGLIASIIKPSGL